MASSDLDPGPDHDGVRRFLDRCRQRLETVATSDEAREGAAVLAAVVDRAEPRPYEPSWLPVLDSTERLSGGGPGRDLADDFVTLAPHLPWTPTHRASDGGTELALAPLDQVFDLGETVVGLMFVGPDATYPLHHHPPQELYLTVAGEGRWRYGGSEEFETVGPNRTLYNHPDDLHSAVAGEVPVVALYVLW